MLVTDRLVFLELQKTGCTHIGELISRCVGGQRIGKHNRAPARLTSRFIVGSIRNPWDWYVSLWAYGCAAKGRLFYALTTPPRSLRWLIGMLARSTASAGSGLRSTVTHFVHSRSRPPDHHILWREAYADADDPATFKRWLTMVFDPAYNQELREGYGGSALERIAGLLTFRYLWLFSRDASAVLAPDTFQRFSDIDAFDSKNSVVDFVIRNEALQTDLVRALEQAGYAVTDDMKTMILQAGGERSNVSYHRPTGDYYDDEAADWIASKERFIIDKYGYRFPV